jgi:precorrin-6B methylase 2
LFDTFKGIPLVAGMSDREIDYAKKFNSSNYFDSFELIQEKFSGFSNVAAVRGILPDTLTQLASRKIAYASVDLNNAVAEKAVIEHIWPKLVPGAVVVIDDYAFKSHVEQYNMWNSFAGSHGVMIATLPTGQGLLIKS